MFNAIYTVLLFLAAVVLNSMGDVHVCAKGSNSYYSSRLELTLTCTAHGQDVLWTTSGFGEGIEDQTRVPAVSLASTSSRVTTTDTIAQTNTSTITLSNFTYDDHGATVSCDSHLPTDQQSITISVGEFAVQCMHMHRKGQKIKVKLTKYLKLNCSSIKL